jgi:hypothetical protein
MGRAASDIPHGMRVLHGRFTRWRKSHTGRLPIPDPLWAAEATRTLQAHQAQLLFAAGNPETAAAPVWRKVS